MVIFGATVIGLLMLTEQGGSTTQSANAISPKYHRYNFEAPCGDFVFRARFRYGPKGRGQVDHVLIDGRPVPGAARTLDRFAARRAVKRIEIIHCGRDPRHPLFWGIMELKGPDSQSNSRQNNLYFRMIQHGQRWKFSVDQP